MASNAKNLSYEPKEPEFLRKLRSNCGASDSDRHVRPIARPRKHMKDADDDDEPTYVMAEGTDVISKSDYDSMLEKTRIGTVGSEHEQDGDARRDTDSSCNTTVTRSEHENAEIVKEQLVTIGNANKRKAVRVIGDDEGEEENRSGAAPIPIKKPAKAKRLNKVKLCFD